MVSKPNIPTTQFKFGKIGEFLNYFLLIPALNDDN